jgi:hypothetical protein
MTLSVSAWLKIRLGMVSWGVRKNTPRLIAVTAGSLATSWNAGAPAGEASLMFDLGQMRVLRLT